MKKETEYLQIGAAYIRVSTDDQTELSPDAQLRELKDGPARNVEDDRKALQSRIQNTIDLLKNPEVCYEVKGNALRGIVKKIVYDKEHGKLKCYYYISI